MSFGASCRRLMCERHWDAREGGTSRTTPELPLRELPEPGYEFTARVLISGDRCSAYEALTPWSRAVRGPSVASRCHTGMTGRRAPGGAVRDKEIRDETHHELDPGAA